MSRNRKSLEAIYPVTIWLVLVFLILTGVFQTQIFGAGPTTRASATVSQVTAVHARNQPRSFHL